MSRKKYIEDEKEEIRDEEIKPSPAVEGVEEDAADAEENSEEETPDAELVRASSAVSRRIADAPFEDVADDEGQLVVDVYQTPDELIVSSPVAGVNPDDLDISITAESVTIRGERRHERKVREEDYF